MKLDKFTVGKRYGKALFELAMEEQRAEAVYHELMTLRQIYQEIPMFGQIVTDNRLDSHKKRKLVDQLFNNFDGLVKNFLEIVYEYNRMDDLLLIIDEYERRYDEQQGLVRGYGDHSSCIVVKSKRTIVETNRTDARLPESSAFRKS